MCGPLHIRYVCEKRSCGRFIKSEAITLVCPKAWHNGYFMTSIRVAFTTERAAFGLCDSFDDPYGTQWLAFSECDHCIDQLPGVDDKTRALLKDIKDRRRRNLFESGGYYWAHVYVGRPRAVGAVARGSSEKLGAKKPDSWSEFDDFIS